MKKLQAIILGAIIITLISCSKETTNNNTTTDNPNINHRVINKTLSTALDSTREMLEIDIDDNDTSDYAIQMELRSQYKSVSIVCIPLGNYTLSTVTDGESQNIVTKLTNNTLINASATNWNQLSAYAFYRTDITPTVNLGHAGAGDILTGVQFAINGKMHFGWILVNVSANMKTVTVKEVAYDIRPNTTIKAGEK
ncbi:MAG: hypothetical protein IPK18_07335 [Sphingobacteriales bacterium]|jgi:hypothetical protein|nr:MAG: hypothetical protein IPK18_07335 [Sphingobacteriales bacterium]